MVMLCAGCTSLATIRSLKLATAVTILRSEMRNAVPRGGRFEVWPLVCLLPLLLSGGFATANELLPPGFRPLPLGVHALVGGKVVTKPGEMLQNGTIVIRDGLIKAVGEGVEIPADARVWDMKGRVIYAGFIEPYLLL